MKSIAVATLVILATYASPASAMRCANGVYRAGCVGPNGAAVVKKHPTSYARCANGVYRAACTGPNGSAVVRKPY
jgi:hypothetical protein